MSRTDRELLRDALEALVFSRINSPSLIEEIRARLAEPEPDPYIYMWEVETTDTHKKLRIMLDEPRFPPGVFSEKPIFPLYRHPPRMVRLSDDELQEIAVSDEFLLYCDQDEFNEIARAIESAIWRKADDPT